MSDYIDRDTAIRIIKTGGYWEREDMEVAIACIEQTPTADVAPVVHGRWLIRNIVTISKNNRKIKSRIFTCSYCGRSNGRVQKPYCPNCGTKMDLED